MKKTTNTQTGNIHSIDLNNYTKPKTTTLLTQTKEYVTYGVDNSYFYNIQDMYNGSCTNAAVIDAFANYIYGEGMKFSNSDESLSKYISKNDQRLISKDIKKFGTICLQIVYTKDRKDIAKIYHLPVPSIAINKQADITDEPTAYWYCFDWRLKNKFKPELIPAFGYGVDSPTEIFVARIASDTPLFSNVDYEPATEYCILEEKLSHYFITHIQNNCSIGKVININQGIPGDDLVKEQMERAMINKIAGQDNAGNIIFSFNDNKDNATTVENIEITDAYAQFQWLSDHARTMIMLGHKVNDPSLFGLPLPSGFSSVAEQMVQSLKILYRNQIKPLREIVIDALEYVFSYNGKGLQIEYIDFPEIVPPPATPQPTTQETQLAAQKVGWDFDGTANTSKGEQMIAEAKANHKDLYIVSARHDKSTMDDFANKHGIPLKNVYATGSNSAKVDKVLELGLNVFYDNNPMVVSQLPSNISILFNS